MMPSQGVPICALANLAVQRLRIRCAADRGDSRRRRNAFYRWSPTAHTSAPVDDARIVPSNEFTNRHWTGAPSPPAGCWILPTFEREFEMSTPAARAALMPNALIAALPARDRTIVARHSETVDLALGDVLAEPGSPITHVYFP